MADGAGLRPGRSCPLDYRYAEGALRAAPSIEADTLIVAGGLYGNPFALDALLAMAAAEPGARLIFNGDFNWFDIDAGDFRRINETVLEHAATRGNVETELAQPAHGAGCGCGYPDWVSEADVERSNRIMERLRATSMRHPALTARLGALPMHAIAQVGAARVVVVHGDMQSLAGWGFAQETLATPAGLAAARAAIEASGASVVASSHTCLPVLQGLRTRAGCALLANNGAAGMPNFRGTRYGLATRISVRPPGANALYGARADRLHVHAMAVDYDAHAWQARFLEQWPAGSDAHRSYARRIACGPDYSVERAVRTAPIAQALPAAGLTPMAGAAHAGMPA